MEGNIVENVKNVASKVSNGVKQVTSGIKKIGNAVKFFLTPIGQVIGIIILAIFLIIVVYVISDVVQHQIGIWFWDDYAGISTTEDYQTIVGALGYTGYDSFISEEKWQEYAAFEYAVLMDVAEHMYEYQDYVTELTNPNNEEYETSAVIPEGIVHTEYNAGDPEGDDKAWWQEWVYKAQGGNPPTESDIGNTEELLLPGGNRDVVAPRLIYEKANHEYEDEAISLMPYLVVVREDIELNYFIQGLTDEEMKTYERNLKDVEADHLEAAYNRKSLETVGFSPILNRFNYNMPSSAYKEDLEEYQREKLGPNNSGEIVGVEDPEGFEKADKEEGYKSDSIYYIEQETDIVYKIPLKLLVNRYLPKSTLLTAWYMLKKDDPDGSFEIDKMMDDIKEIYNAACYEVSNPAVKEIKTTGKKNDKGVIERNVAAVTLRTPAEDKWDNATVTSVQYDDYGAIIRNASGEAIMGDETIDYATSNLRTFIYFEQFGLETSRYEKYKIYLGPSGDNAPYSGDEARPEAEAPSATFLTRERVNFVETLNLTLMNITYLDESGEEQTEDIKVKLKPTYSHIDEPYPDLLEKAKSNYLFGSSVGAPAISQDAPYSFMSDVVDKAENKMGNTSIQAPGGAELYFINELYIMAESGNAEELLEKAGGNPENIDPNDIEYKLVEDYRYYNQDGVMPNWYDLRENNGYITQEDFEEYYLEAFWEIYKDSNYESPIKDMLLKELEEDGYEVKDGKVENILDFGKDKTDVKYTYEGDSATLYDGDEHVRDMEEVVTGNYQINYYWDAVYTIEEKTLQMRQAIHHRRMPAVLVKYCDSWAKFTEYDNKVWQNPLDYRNYVFLIPEAVTSLGLEKMQLNEKSSFRVDTFKDYFNKSSGSEAGIKEGDVLDMLIQWEDYANKGGDASAYAYMRDLYKLALFIRDSGQMYESAYTYLYIPSTISNYDDETLQKIFWLERLGVTQGEDELTEEEQNQMRVKAIDTRWQNLEYDEYYECIYDSGDGDEGAKVYALFPFGSPYVRSYCMIGGWKTIVSQEHGGGHSAVDMCSRSAIKKVLNKSSAAGEHIYYYELNRLTLKYMNQGNTKQDAFMLAEKELNDTLRESALYSPIVAIAPGYVTKVDYDARSGFYVEIAHDSGENGPRQITSFYAHMKRWPLVEVDEVVGAGTILGYEGTTGRSTGNHLHFELNVDGRNVDPRNYITPVFSPFYYDIKAEAVLEADEEMALGTEYYTLERTILLEDALYNNYNVINGMKLSNGDVVNYTAPTNRAEPYKSGDDYEGAPYAEKIIWGNNVPAKEIASNVDKIIDLNLLNQTVPFEFTSGDNGDGGTLKGGKDFDVTSNTNYFNKDADFFKERLEWPTWFAIEMAEYKSERVVPYYNGPRSPSDAIENAEALRDLKAMQDSLRDAGYYQMAGVKWEEAGYGTYSDLFVNVVKTMQQDLIDKGYDKFEISVNGNLDKNTVAAYNTMMQYTSSKNQFVMAEKTSYNSSLDLSIEPALIWAYAQVEGEFSDEYLALKEEDSKTGTVEDYYKLYPKVFNKDQGILQINPKLAIERYKEDKVESEDALQFIRQPMRNTNIGMEIIKEDMLWIYENFSGDIEKAKNDVLYGRQTSGFWYDILKEIQNPEGGKTSEDVRWIDPENMDRLMLYALGTKMYEKRGESDSGYELTESEVEEILDGQLGEYEQKILNNFKTFVMEKKNAAN